MCLPADRSCCLSSDGGGTCIGAAFLVLGSGAPASANLSTAIVYTGEAARDFAGYPVSAAGDVDADGYADMTFGAYANDDSGADAGASYLVLGSTAPASTGLSSAVQFTGEGAYDYAGSAVSGAGDINADGYADVLIGAGYSDKSASDAGAAYLILGTGL